MLTRQSASIPIREESQVGEARRTAVSLASLAGFDETQSGRAAIVVTEAARNLLIHTGGAGGEIVVQIMGGEDAAMTGGMTGSAAPNRLDIYALDKGPGMRNVAECLRDGFSMAGTAGQGLGAMQRLADEFEVYSHAQTGTVVYASLRGGDAPGKSAGLAASWQLGIISLAKTGESECGDSWGYTLGTPTSRFIVADGLGHGPMASEASCAAVDIFGKSAGRSLSETMEAMHGALRSTRGAAVSMATVDMESGSVGFVGVGNVAGVLARGAAEGLQGMAGHNGTVGAQMHKVHEFTYTLPQSDGVILLASDGLTTQWQMNRYPGLLHRHPALIAGVLYRDYNRGRDDVTIFAAKPTFAAKASTQ